VWGRDGEEGTTAGEFGEEGIVVESMIEGVEEREEEGGEDEEEGEEEEDGDELSGTKGDEGSDMHEEDDKDGHPSRSK